MRVLRECIETCVQYAHMHDNYNVLIAHAGRRGFLFTKKKKIQATSYRVDVIPERRSAANNVPTYIPNRKSKESGCISLHFFSISARRVDRDSASVRQYRQCAFKHVSARPTYVARLGRATSPHMTAIPHSEWTLGDHDGASSSLLVIRGVRSLSGKHIPLPMSYQHLDGPLHSMSL
jgi:hypothetical protein